GLFELQQLRRVAPPLGVGDDLQAPAPRDHGGPGLDARVYPAVELRQVFLVFGAPVWIELRQPLLDLAGDDLRVRGRDPVVRVALRVDVAHRAVHLRGRDVEHRDRARAIQVSQLSGLDLRVAGA